MDNSFFDPRKTKGIRFSAWRLYVGKASIHLFLILGCLVTLIPFIWMILASFKTQAEITQIPPTFFPKNPTFSAYRTLLSDPRVPLLRYYLNSIIQAVSVVGLTLITSSLAGFVFSKYKFFARNALFAIILSSMMIPFQAVMIPSYLLLVKLKLIDSLWGLIVPSAVSAYGIFLMKSFIDSLPDETLDAARIDGASEYGVYWRVVLPQLGPPLATLGILTFMSNWNHFLWPLIVITSSDKRTLPIILTLYNDINYQRYDLNMAAGVMVIVPILIVYIFVQRYIVKGYALSGIK